MNQTPSPSEYGKAFFLSPVPYLTFIIFILYSIYQPALLGPFLLDDFNNLPLATIHSLNLDELINASMTNTSGAFGRFVSAFSFALTSYISGTESYGFKQHNLMLHLVTIILVYFSTKQILIYLDRYKPEQTTLIALVTAICWGAHPLMVSTILYAVQRMTILACLFSLLTVGIFFYAHNHWGKGKNRSLLYWFFLFLSLCITFPLAFFSKENGIFALLLIGLLLMVSYLSHSRFTFRELVSVFFIITLVSTIALINSDYIIHQYQNSDMDVLERLIAESRIIAEYLWMIIFPFSYKFGFFYDDIILYTQFTSITILTVVLHFSLITLAIYLVKTRPLVTIGIFWFYGCHLAESTLIPLELMWEHRNYLPSIGIVVIIVQLIIEFVSRINLKLIRVLLVISIPFLLTTETIARSSHWTDSVSLAEHLVKNHPTSCRSRALYADVYISQSKKVNAKEQIKNCLDNNPGQTQYHIRYLGESCQEPTLPETNYQLTLELLSNDYISRYTITAMFAFTNLYRSHQCPAAKQEQVFSLVSLMIQNLEKRKNIEGLTKAYPIYGRLFRFHGNYEQAETQFRKALVLNSDSLATELELVENSIAANNYSQALSELASIKQRYVFEKHSIYLKQRYEQFINITKQ